MFEEMAADSSMGMGMGFHQGASSLHHHHHNMLSFQSNPDSAPAPAPAPPAPPVFLPSPNAPVLQGAPPKYKFVTGSPSDWTPYELSIFQEGLARYAREPTIMKYIKIAAMLPTKTIRDVALRCRWTAGKESRRRKPDEFYAGKRIRDLKEKMIVSTSLANFQMAPPNNLVPFSMSMHHPVLVLDNATQHLLEENNQLLNQISANIETFKLGENMDLFVRTNNNIRTILKRMGETPGVMGQMRPLPEPVNEGQLNSLLQLDRVVASYGDILHNTCMKDEA
uniref:Myb-like domain-containing protein n=1 Tax=Triticum aestivum TaxID=4565 RepID=A0A3B6TTJ1_WHEAT